MNHLKRFFRKKRKGFSEKTGKGQFLRKDVYETQGRKDEPTLIGVYALKSKFTQQNFHYMCNLALHKTLWRTQSSFLFLFGSLCITRKTLTTLSLHCAFSELPQFQNTLNRGNLSFHHKRQCAESVAQRQGSCTTLSSTFCKLNNSISQTSVLSRT